MDKITQEAYFRQRFLQYAEKHSVTETANRFRISRKTIHKWKKRYDGTIESLKDRSRRPHHFPRQQTAEELKLIRRYVKKYRGDLLLGYEKACAQGYTRSYGCFKRTASKLVQPGKKNLLSKVNRETEKKLESRQPCPNTEKSVQQTHRRREELRNRKKFSPSK